MPIAGTRPAGIITAGAAQKMINIGGLHVGEKAVILGSGDVGLILARRLVLEGKTVVSVVERLSYVGGLLRNKVQCLDDYGIPLLLSHTITEIYGRYRVEGVAVCPVDEYLKPIEEKKKIINCDTLITSVGLVPEAELARDLGLVFHDENGRIAVNDNLQTSLPWVFACGNLLYIHDLVDDVTREALAVGEVAAGFVLIGESNKKRSVAAQMKDQYKKEPGIHLKPEELVCLLCPTGCLLNVSGQKGAYEIKNNGCDKGVEYALSELDGPVRNVTSTITIGGDPFIRLPVRTSQPVPKDKIFQVMQEIRKLDISAPVAYHQVLISNVADCTANIIAASEFPAH